MVTNLSTATTISIVERPPLPVISLHPTQTGALPYFVAVYPLEGAIPTGQAISSTDDPSMRSSVLSRWPDGSAAVVVLAGVASVTAGTVRTLALAAASDSGTALTAARVAQLVSEITISCGALGSASIASFASPEKTWWANERVICCRYRVPVGNDATLEAVIDIHAFSSDHVFVEIVLENGKLNAKAANPAAPAGKSYTANVTVNGASIATVGAAAGPAGNHEAFRAWYVSHWVGGDPGLEATHDAAAIQAHPLLFKVWRSGGSVADYAADLYTPWSVGRFPASNLGSGGDSPQIGPLPKWDATYLQTGSKEGRRAVLASALGMLTFGISYRDTATGMIPRLDVVHPKRMTGAQDWPQTPTEPTIDGGAAHHGAAGLMAFLCRPSPVFIEIAQKIATWAGTNYSTDGVFGTDYQQRGYAWCMRSLAHAIFLTPDSEAWKAPARADLAKNVQRGLAFKYHPNNKLDFIWDDTGGDGPPGSNLYDFESDPGCQQPSFMVAYQITEIPKIANAKLLVGAEQAALVELADWICRFPVRFVNEATAGEWRAVGASRLTVSSSSSAFVESNWAAVQAFQFNADSPPPVAGKWLTGRGVSTYAELTPIDTAGAYYESYFWAALVAAVERDIPGAAAAWTRVTASITNLQSWSDGFIAEPRWGAYPRNK
jgi:hypothetical protein